MKTGNSLVVKITSCFMILLLTIFLFYTGNNGFTDIQNAKYKTFLLLCGGYVLISLICVVECALIGATKIPSLKNMFNKMTCLQKLALLYLLFVWISALVSTHFGIVKICAVEKSPKFDNL